LHQLFIADLRGSEAHVSSADAAFLDAVKMQNTKRVRKFEPLFFLLNFFPKKGYPFIQIESLL